MTTPGWQRLQAFHLKRLIDEVRIAKFRHILTRILVPKVGVKPGMELEQVYDNPVHTQGQSGEIRGKINQLSLQKYSKNNIL